MPLVAIEAIIKLALFILEYFLNRSKMSEAQKQRFRVSIEEMRVANIRTIQLRKKSEQQLDAGSSKWDEIEKSLNKDEKK